jgi:hypothetical protein
MTKENIIDKNLIKWIKRNKKRKNRENNLNTFGTLFGFIFLNFILFTQFVLGPFRFYSFADIAIKVILIEFIAVIILIFIKPEFTLKYLNKFMKLSGAGITMVVVTFLLGTLYLISLPFAKYFGRKYLVSKHKHITPWVGKTPWNGFDSTWQSKDININKSKSGNVFRNIVMFFLSERNYFLLPIVIIIIIIASFMLIASAPVVAPFIYPL